MTTGQYPKRRVEPGHCARHGRRICVWCVATTLSFPVEHLAWERLPVLRVVTRMLGL